MAIAIRILRYTASVIGIQTQEGCDHPYLLINKSTGKKICAFCERTIQSGK